MLRSKKILWNFKKLLFWVIVLIIVKIDFIPAQQLAPGEEFIIFLGHSEIMEFPEPVKRVSITDPEIADATVTSPRQIVINGIAVGKTSMIVWDERENYIKYKLIVRKELSPNQVRLEVHFAEVKHTALRQIGMDFLIMDKKIGDEYVSGGSFSGKVETPSVPLGLGEVVDLFLSIPTENFSAIIKAMERKNLLTTLAKPNLSAVESEEASFLAGGEFPVPVPQAMGLVSIQWKEFGVKLKFTPAVLDSQMVSIKLTTEVSSLDFENGITLSGFRIPALISRKSETTIELKDGEHFAIGGLVSNEVAKTISRVPVLGKLPILGKLFSSTYFLNNESELIVMISPTILDQYHKN